MGLSQVVRRRSLETASARGEGAGAHPLQRTARPMRIEKFSYDDAVVRKFVFATVIWGIVATLAGLWLALLLVLPQLSLGLPQLSFGRLRPLHTNAAIFAFAGN